MKPKRVGKNGPLLVSDSRLRKPKLIYNDGFFLLGTTWKELEECIAADAGSSVRTVRKHLALAEERGWIERMESEDGVGIKFLIPEVKP
jgi:hypothetical protein